MDSCGQPDEGSTRACRRFSVVRGIANQEAKGWCDPQVFGGLAHQISLHWEVSTNASAARRSDRHAPAIGSGHGEEASHIHPQKELTWRHSCDFDSDSDTRDSGVPTSN